MKPSFQIHLSDDTNNVEVCRDLRRERDIILDVGGEKFLSNRDIIKTFPATRSEYLGRDGPQPQTFLGWAD